MQLQRSVAPRGASTSHRPARRAYVGVVRAAAERETVVLDNKSAVRLSSSRVVKQSVGPCPGGDLAAYMRASPAFFDQICNLPGGGALVPVDLEQGLFNLTVPQLKLFDLWLQPHATARVRVEELGPGAVRLVVNAEECTLTGSEHVEKFKLNERFELEVGITFVSQQNGLGAPGTITTDGRIQVKVDVPPPFSMMPSFMLQSTGDTALAATLSILLTTFTASMAEEYQHWVRREQQHQLQQAQATQLAPATAGLPADAATANGSANGSAAPGTEAAHRQQAAAWMQEREGFTSMMSD